MTTTPMTFGSFQELRQAARDYLLTELPFSGIQSPGNVQDMTRISDHFCNRAVRYLSRHPGKSDCDKQRMQERLLPRVHAEVCGFVITGSLILESLISWALCKLLDWLWGKWWVADHNSQSACTAMAVSCGSTID